MRLSGRICVAIDKNMNERFLNLMHARNIRIWDAKCEEDNVLFYMEAKSYFELKPVLKKTGIFPKIVKKNGIIFRLKRFSSKKSVILGLLLFCISLFLFTRMIWNIRIEDNYLFSNEEIVSLLNDNNIYAGCLKKNINCLEIENLIRVNYENIGWVSARVEGSTLIIQLKENLETEDNKRAFNTKEKHIDNVSFDTGNVWTKETGSLVAPCDGVVAYIVTGWGNPKVKKGDVVKKGQVLIDGMTHIYDDFGVVKEDKESLARGDVYIQSDYYYSSKVNIRYTKKDYNDEKKLYYIRFNNRKLILYKPFNIPANCDIMFNECSLGIDNDILKEIRFGEYSFMDYTSTVETYTKQQARDILTKELNDNINELAEQEIYLKDYTLKFNKDKDFLELSGTLNVMVRANQYIDIVYDNNEKGAESKVGN